MKLLQATIMTCALCALTQLISGKPDVQVDQMVVAFLGETATLPCEFTGKPISVIWGEGYATASIIQWGGHILYNIDEAKYNTSIHLSSEKSQISLQIYDVNMTDIGDYFCAVTSSEGRMMVRKYVALHVEVPPTLDPYPRIVNRTHDIAPTTPASITTIPTSTELQNTTPSDDNGYVNSRSDLWWIAVIFGVVIIVVAIVIIAVYRKGIREAIKQRRCRCQRTPIGSTRSPSPPNRDDNENEAVNETLMTTVC